MPNYVERDGRRFKKIDSQRIISQIPDLERIEATAENGFISGELVSLRWDGKWSSQTSHLPRNAGKKEDIVLNSDIGKFCLYGAFWTSYGALGKTEGTCLYISHQVNPAPPGTKQLFRTVIPVDHSASILLPEWFQDANGASASAWLPLKSADGQLDVFYIKEKSWVVLETSRDGLTYEQYKDLQGSLRQFATYFLGINLSGKACDLILSEDESTVHEIYWYSGRDIKGSIYHPVPASWGEWIKARDATPVPKTMNFRDAEVLSKCWCGYLAHPALFITIEYILHFPSAPVEMRGAILSVALESLTRFVLDKHGVKAVAPISDDSKWKMLFGEFERVLNQAEKTSPDAGYAIIRKKLTNLNQPTNKDKLSQPFALYGVTLTKAEQDTIKERDRLLHSGVLLSLDSRKAAAAWKEAYEIEMILFTLINRLLLSVLDYEGPIINWKTAPPLGDAPTFFYRDAAGKHS